MIYITGDKHRDFSGVHAFCREHQTTKDDLMIVLGDAGINYLGDERDDEIKRYISRIPITFFCIHGNHEMRPWNVNGCVREKFYGAEAFTQEQYPSIFYGIDGQVYDFKGIQVLVAGGAYSVDKYYRLEKGLRWFQDEQPSDEIKQDIDRAIDEHKNIHVVMSHTCPYKFTPFDRFLPGIDQSTVDNSTEKYLDTVEERVGYWRWYCGHWHIDRTVDRVRFVFNDIIEIGD